MVDCSEKLRMLRETRHLTQQQVADRIGISKAMVSASVSVDYLVCIDSRQGLDVTGLDDESVALLSSFVEKLKNPAKE